MPKSDDPKDGQTARIIKASTPAWKGTAKQLFFCKLIFRHNWLAG
jgi:hypothetical protein